MRRQGICITFILAISTMSSGISGERYLFHLPWVCSVLHNQGGLVGACSILNSNNVLVSVDNFNETVKDFSDPPVRYLGVIEELVVFAGSNFMDPLRRLPSPTSYQKKGVSKLHVAFKVPRSSQDGAWEFKTNPKDISEKVGFEHDAYGLAFNVGILELRESLIYTEYVEPMLLNGPDISSNTKNFLSKLERTPIPKDSCVTYSWNKKLNRIRYHEVTFVNKVNCLEAYCHWKLSKCCQFPQKYYLGCFRSVVFADVCPNARGAALYCPTFNHSVFGILTTAPSCGRRHLSGVYTTLPPVLELYEKVYNKKFEIPKVQYELGKLRQKNSDYDGIP